jgi:hypothetical protein
MFFFKKSKFSTIIIITVFLTASFCSITTVSAAQLTWTVQTVDAAADVGEYTSLAIDSAGNLHASYWDHHWNDLKYAKLTGSVWTITPVDTVGEIGYLGTSIDVDSTNNPHISYYDYTNGDLKYARWTGSSWNIQTVDSTGVVGSHSSLALDSNNRAHIIYEDYTNQKLKYAHWTGSTWDIQTVESTDYSGLTSSLAIDSNNRPHIAYYQADYATTYLKYARWTGSAWNFETVESGPVLIGYFGMSLKLDSSNNPHISYFDDVQNNLKYAKKTGTTWTTETVDASQNVGGRSSLSLDSTGHPHIAYWDAYWHDLKYAKLTTHGWFIRNVDNIGNVGDYPSLVLDSTNHPHVVYRDETNKNLKYARDPNEYFFTIATSPFDDDGDLKDDAVEATIDVDTTHSGALNVFVFGYLEDSIGHVYGYNSSSWQITFNQIEPKKIIFKLPAEAAEGNYDLYLQLSDDSQTIEDTRNIYNVAYLYPPTTGNTGLLAGNVTDFNTGLPMQGIEIYVDETPTMGTYKALTNAAGQYSIELPEGEHEITAHETEGSLYSDGTATVTIIQNTTTIQDFHLQRKNWALSTSKVGSGTTEPPSGIITHPDGSQVEVNASPEEGWILAYWLLDGVNVGNENPYTVTMNSDHSLEAVFLEETEIGIFWGTVLDAESETPIGEAHLIIHFSTFQTDPGGNFEIELEAGEYTVLVEAIGYQSQERQVTVEAGGDTEEIFLLQNIESYTATIESSNSVAEQKDFFELGETVYVAGNGYSPSTTYNLYVVEDVETWIEGMPIPTRISGTATTISSNTEGGITPTVAWSNPQIEGKYDIIVDVNDNGFYDPEVDALDDSDIEVTAGMVVPEFSTFPLLSLFIALSVFAFLFNQTSKKKRPPSLKEKRKTNS